MAEWKTTPMGALCSIKNGKSNTEDAVEDGPYAFFDRSKQVKRSSKYLFDCEALIIPGEGTEFLPKEYRGKFDLHQRAYALYEFKDIDPKYLYYFLIHSKDYWPRVAVGATVKSLRLRHFEDLPVTHPPLPEQQRIVTKLDAAFAALAEAQAHVERNRANARELFESYLNGVFEGRGGWEEVRLGDLIDIQNGFAFKSDEYTASGHFLMRISNVQDGIITLDNPKYVQIDEARKERFVLDEGDILVSLTGNIGRVGVVKAEHLPAALNQRVARVTVRERKRLQHSFLFFFLRSSYFREHLQNAGHGAAQQNVSTSEMAEVRFSLPPFHEQQHVMEALEAIQQQTTQLESIYQQKLMELEGLKKGLLGAAFRGEL